MERRLAATTVIASASSSDGRSETNAGAITAMSTQPGAASMTACARGLRVRFRSTTNPRIRVRYVTAAIAAMVHNDAKSTIVPSPAVGGDKARDRSRGDVPGSRNQQMHDGRDDEAHQPRARGTEAFPHAPQQH